MVDSGVNKMLSFGKKKVESVEPSLVMTELQAGSSSSARDVKRNKKSNDDSFSSLPQAGDFSINGKQEFAEIYGSALVSRRQHFITAVCALILCAVSMFYALNIASTKTAIPWFVEVDKSTGQLSKPVKIQSLTPQDAVIKSTLAIFAEKCFTIDPKLSRVYLQECARMATGKAIEQLRAFRTEHDVIARMTKGSEIRFAKTKSVDLTTKGTAFLYVETKDVAADGVSAVIGNYRLRLDYVFIPPKNEDELIQNPLGIYVSMFNPSLER